MPGISPLQDSIGDITFSVEVNGQRLPASDALLSATVRRAANKLPSAILVFTDGDIASSDFPLSDTVDFKPGAQLTIKPGYGQADDVIFNGIVVRHGLRVSGGNDACLVVECRDAAVKMTVGRRNANHIDKTDGDMAVTYGADLISFNGDVEARDQYGSATAVSWDPRTQAAVEGSVAGPASLPAQGDLDSATLSEVIGLARLRLQAGAPQSQAMLSQWAEAQQTKSGLARVTQRGKSAQGRDAMY